MLDIASGKQRGLDGLADITPTHGSMEGHLHVAVGGAVGCEVAGVSTRVVLSRCFRRVYGVIAILLLTSGGVSAAPPAEEVTLTLEAFPACQVFVDGPMGLSYLGRSGTPLRVSPPLLRDRAGRPVQYAAGTLVLRCEGHADVRVPVSAQEWGSA